MQYDIASVEFRLLKLKFQAERSYTISKDYLEARRWEIFMSSQVPQDKDQALKNVIGSLQDSLSKMIDLLEGKYMASGTANTETTHKVPPQQYLELLGNKPFSSLNEIIGELKSVTQELTDAV